MASLDDESLHSNIPLEETIENIINDFYLTTDKVRNFEKHKLKQLLMFAAFESFFVFVGFTFEVDGFHASTLANGFLCF